MGVGREMIALGGQNHWRVVHVGQIDQDNNSDIGLPQTSDVDMPPRVYRDYLTQVKIQKNIFFISPCLPTHYTNTLSNLNANEKKHSLIRIEWRWHEILVVSKGCALFTFLHCNK